ncbi:hypothetical protein QU660_06850 [Stomatobaculum sp. F0698]|uniref:hypothetical protein n=1 Tax=Stomatobaculum sp. F0698 TaxID=3059030 RepID=UPI00272AEDBE|nr:hypothetical protein [Stomatobaculum sp. F0698]WLD86212.1 hypothetical protein QU660_06850 [Stomatobaculum sp. F0698]
MERYSQYSKVILKDGRTATVVEILKENVEYIVDVDLEGPDWDTIEVSADEISGLLKDKEGAGLQ